MNFVYVLAGWEGSAHDCRVLDSAKRKGFEAPLGRYYVADAGYSNTPMTLTPYRAVRYHLREQAQANIKPQNAKELFNLRHSALRNIIKRTFGVFKKRFRYFESARQNFSITTQVDLVYALTAVHNFINMHDLHDLDSYDDMEEVDEEDAQLAE
jgi:hypothetical protein